MTDYKQLIKMFNFAPKLEELLNSRWREMHHLPAILK